jgi:hypothetical protein
MILRSLHLLLVVLPLHQVVHLLLVVLPLHQAQNRHQEVHLPEKVLLRQLLIIQTIHRQINLLLKVAVVNPKQAKLKQQVIAPANQVLV